MLANVLKILEGNKTYFNFFFFPSGTLKLMEGADKLLWSVQVDHQLFALEKLDVTVSVCEWGWKGAKQKHGVVLCVGI